MSSEASVAERFVHARRHLEHKASPGGLNPGLKWWRWGRVELPAWCSSPFTGVRWSRNFRPFVVPTGYHHSSHVAWVGVRLLDRCPRRRHTLMCAGCPTRTGKSDVRVGTWFDIIPC